MNNASLWGMVLPPCLTAIELQRNYVLALRALSYAL